MQILFNDQPVQCPEFHTISMLLKDLNRLTPGSALAVNQNIIPRDQWDHIFIQDGDQILLFQAIAGG